MPELPEVETVCRGIKQRIIGKKIDLVQTSNKRLRLPFPENLIDLEGKEIISVARRARYILIEISSNDILLIHLGMSGKLLFHQEFPEILQKHDHFVMKFEDDSCLIYNDTRRFGLVDLVAIDKIDQHQMIKNLGVEPLSEEFNADHLREKLKGKKINIKTAMMDNAVVVGVGNIYINESLFECKISPLKEAGKVGQEELEILVKNIKNILQKAIESGGSTLRDYVQLNGDVGSFQFDFKTYGRENEDCVSCNDKIIRIKQNGRSTFYCPTCQK
ncbi:MAG: formamidopyrimidine-DNA glycosylase [Rickettsiales bacterium]|jgi:formamidopyrimidine-DNA glycosylase